MRAVRRRSRLAQRLGAGELVDYGELVHLPAWLERCLDRPAVQRGLEIPKRP